MQRACDVCSRLSDPRDLLQCSLCDRRFHFPRPGREEANCGVVAPNPYSESGC